MPAEARARIGMTISSNPGRQGLANTQRRRAETKCLSPRQKGRGCRGQVRRSSLVFLATLCWRALDLPLLQSTLLGKRGSHIDAGPALPPCAAVACSVPQGLMVG